ncbi:MAG: leucyl aminopeptidase family protein, partial [Candidatus Peribacteraceae bacterium]|nr:leucyl aminopeptidase family protein [Candidatus Peribacteraceae bacterium]
LIGKGVTYDTGGYSIKPSQYMESMKQDLGGAATVLGAFLAIASLGVKKNVIAVLPSVENSINSYAYRPDDIIKMYNGVTVEVTNTDAEGRIILADALAYTAKKYSPSYMIDLATLTGSCIYAVGNDFAAVLGTDDKLIEKIIEAGKEAGEPMWQLPLHQRYKKDLESPVADIVNASKMRAGTIEGGLFLQHFVPEKMKWCHIDIAAVAFDEKKKMATGRDVRMLLELVKKL